MFSYIQDVDEFWLKKCREFYKGHPMFSSILDLCCLSVDGVVWLTIPMILFIFYQKEQPSFAFKCLYLLVTTVVLGSVEFALKLLVRRERPAGGLTKWKRGPDHYSFPSGHTMRGMFLFRLLQSREMFDFVSSPLFCYIGWTWALCCGISRVTRGKHWPSDVLCGLVFGFCFHLLNERHDVVMEATNFVFKMILT